MKRGSNDIEYDVLMCPIKIQKYNDITVFRLMIGICLSGWGWDQQWDDKKSTALPQIQVFTHFHFLSLPQI